MYFWKSMVVVVALASAACGGEGGGAAAGNAGGTAGSGAGGGGGGSGGVGGGPGEEPAREICGNGIDDDGDGADDFADAACAAEEAFQATLEELADAARGRRVPGLVVGVTRPDGTVAIAASGTRKQGGEEAVLPDDRFPIGSITKTFTAAVVMQLRDEGRLSLDDTLDRWAPDFPRAERIAIHHLLQHTSGVPNYTAHEEFVEALNEGASFTVEQMLAWAAGMRPLFEPGAELWSYSNTNYLLLGLVIEAETGGTAAEAIRARILEPLGMRDTYLLGGEPWEEALAVHGYFAGGLSGDVDLTDFWDGTGAWTAGAVVSTAADMLRFSHGLANGALVDEASFHEMSEVAIQLTDELAYGYGLLIDEGRVGHDGATFGWMANWLRRPDGATVVALQNRYDEGVAVARAVDSAFELLPPQ